MLLELINYDCICEIVKNLSIKYWNNFRLASQYTKDITDKAEIDHYVNQFNNVIMKEFKPFKLNINNISLCNEYIPYMHMDREKGCVFDHPLLV